MGNHGAFEKDFGVSEQDDEVDQGSTWDSLTDLSESETWDEHLEKVDDLVNPVEKTTPLEVKELSAYVGLAKHNQKTFFQDLARQEKLERELNSELSHVEDLELLVEAGDPSVEKTTVRYLNQEIPVYILKGYPMKFLAHIINYREGDHIAEASARTADDLVNNPKKWSEPYQPPEAGSLVGGWVSNSERAMSNTLSASYADGTLRSFDDDLAHGDGNHYNSIIYGFDHIRPMSLIYANSYDGRVPNYLKQGKSLRDRSIQRLVSSLDQLDTSKNGYGGGYNEVAMLRYDESGKPLEPSFMVTDNPGILRDTESLPEEATYWMGENLISKEPTVFT